LKVYYQTADIFELYYQTVNVLMDGGKGDGNGYRIPILSINSDNKERKESKQGFCY